MADRNPLWVSHTGGVVTIDDARIGMSSLWTPGSSNVNARKGLRPGASTAANSPGLVAAQGTPDKTVKVNAFQATIPASRATGSFIVTHDAASNPDLLTAHPAHASLQRNDLIVAQVSDETFDSANGFAVVQIVGTPSGTPTDPAVNTTNGAPTNSPDYITLARVRVTAGASTITAAMIDDLRPPWMVAVGGVLPVANATDRATLTPYDGMTIWRIDRAWVEIYSIAAGGWLVQDAVGSSLADIQSAVTTPYAGQWATTTTGLTYIYVGGAWVDADSTAFAGRRYVTGGTIAGPTSGSTEGLCNVDTGTIAFEANSEYQIDFSLNYSATVAGDVFNFIIRDTNLAGAVIMQAVEPSIPTAGVPQIVRRTFLFRTTSSVSKKFVSSVQRVSGTGTASITASSNGSTYAIATRLGPNSVITEV